jgi:hypothetical protein
MMINFDSIEYLKTGNDKQRRAYQVLVSHQIFDTLHSFSPLLTGTIPIGIDTEESDLDIICYWQGKSSFISTVSSFSQFLNYRLSDLLINGYPTVICRFTIDGFDVEVFGQNRPSKDQEAYRHMIIEHQILLKKGESFRTAVTDMKQKGVRTEPAFAMLLGLKGNPYEELLRVDPDQL